MPDEKALPPPDEEFFEMEAAKAFHYTWSAWLAESPIIRARLLAHELTKGMRDSYNFEQRMAHSEREASGPKAAAPWDVIRKQFFK